MRIEAYPEMRFRPWSPFDETTRVGEAAPTCRLLPEARGWLTVADDGVVSVKGREVAMTELSPLISAETKQSREPSVLIVAGAKAPIRTLTSVMDLCRKAGIHRFSLKSP